MDLRPSIICADSDAAFYRGLVNVLLIAVWYIPASRNIKLSGS